MQIRADLFNFCIFPRLDFFIGPAFRFRLFGRCWLVGGAEEVVGVGGARGFVGGGGVVLGVQVVWLVWRVWGRGKAPPPGWVP